ncbi:kinase-like (PK-like) [Fusarium mundagurra]|uniref:Kinase-like (PK-like) n=1 Tax=Fusarium mundagurra TaxID=1567541 RepID=A0A8H5Z372_9HYPO|nr:kinase-like (PK-like) [Fusarium mundagurra]
MEPLTSLLPSGVEDDSNGSSSLPIPSFNFILPSRPNTPLPLGETSYLGSAGLLDESVSHELGLNDPIWSLDLTIDNTEQLQEAVDSSHLRTEVSGPLVVIPEIESLEQQLRGAICQHAHKESKGFLPLDKLNEIVIEDSVSVALRECIPHLSHDDAQFHATAICPRSQRNLREPSFRRIFAILTLIQQPQEVFAFMENNITDLDLPLVKVRGEHKGRYELRRKFQPNRPLEGLDKWSPFLIDSFEGCQWMMMSPFFSWENKRAVRTYFLADQTILPFIEDSSRDVDMEDDEDFQGGHGSIFKVKIHPAHHNFHHIAEAHDSDSAFAVKRLHSRSREMFSREVDALKRLSGQKHIVPLLATFEYKNSYHLLFPWANANLRRYWSMFPNPSIDRRYGLWVAKQCKGMAEGLSIIHEPPPDQSDDYAYEAALQPSHRQSQSSQSYGRHGDIKPENILWFRNGPNTDIGVLEIADFGLTRFHNRRSRSNISPVGMGNSPTYRAPEFDMPDGLLSRSYDIWALGCVYLEFLTWYFMGWDGVMEFSALREYKRNNLEADDAYFELTGAPETGNICSKVKPEVVHWVASLHQHWACSPFFHDFLDLIKDSMLVVETDGEVPVRRATAAEVKQSLVRFYNRSGSNATYLYGENPLNLAISTRFLHGSDNGNPTIRGNKRRSSTVAGPETGTKPNSLTRPTYKSWDQTSVPSKRKAKTHQVGRRSTTDGSCDSSSLFQRGSRSTSFSGTSHGLASTSSSDPSHRLVTTTQTTQETTGSSTKDNNSPLACPFFKRDPSKCSRCLSYFDNSAGLEEHVRSVEPCILRESADVEGLNAEQERRLRSRKRTRTETESNEVDRDIQRWHEMYKIIFPDADAQTISPSYTANGSSETIADYSKFIDGGIPSEVQNKLQATINRELGFSELEGRRIIDILPILQQTLLQSFQNHNEK